MWWTLFILFLLISIFSSTALFYALKRLNQYEIFLSRIQGLIEYSSNRMKQVDSTGHYEADDETGFFFEEIKKIQNILDNLFETQETRDAKKEK
tara:strand:- start:113 stop:394 length:282 start_codon:yes stop_codon:yes gene_type:complete